MVTMSRHKGDFQWAIYEKYVHYIQLMLHD